MKKVTCSDSVRECSGPQCSVDSAEDRISRLNDRLECAAFQSDSGQKADTRSTGIRLCARLATTRGVKGPSGGPHVRGRIQGKNTLKTSGVHDMPPGRHCSGPGAFLFWLHGALLMAGPGTFHRSPAHASPCQPGQARARQGGQRRSCRPVPVSTLVSAYWCAA